MEKTYRMNTYLLIGLALIDGDLVSVNNELYMIVKVENTSQESE